MITIIAALTILTLAATIVRWWLSSKRHLIFFNDGKHYGNEHTNPTKQALPANVIEPLSDFDWASTEPKKLWGFKPKYYITMG